MGHFPLLDYLIVTCESVAQGINQLARYFRLNDAPYALEIRENEDPVCVIFHGTRDSLTFEFGVSLVVLHLREETENRLNAAFVSFTHRPEDVVEMQRVLGCPVRGGETGTDSLSPAMPGNFPCGGAIRFCAEYLNATPKKSLPAYRQAIT